MFINKEWYNLYQSKVYREISTNLDISDQKLMNIISSPFQPGEYVKIIEFAKIVCPPGDTFEDVDIDHDLLQCLINRTRKAMEVKFKLAKPMALKDWVYFIGVNTSVWKLGYLPKLVDSNYSAYYYNWAYQMRSSLLRLDLTRGMIGKNYIYLGKFKALQRLEVDRKMIGNTKNLYELLKHAPHISALQINCDQSIINVEMESTDSITFKNIKILVLRNYAPSKDQELLYFMKFFSSIDQLGMSKPGGKEVSWTQKNAISTTYHFRSGGDYEIQLSGGSNQSKVFAAYDMGAGNSLEPKISRMMHTLSHVNRNYQTLAINVGVGTYHIGKYIKTILSQEHSKLQTLVLQGGLLDAFEDTTLKS